MALQPNEVVILLSEDGQPIGTAPKATVHTEDTPLHLAFSSYLFDDEGNLLVTRRAIDKPTWPGEWSNSCCGHPAEGEKAAEAVVRRVRQELGLEISDVRPVLPNFRYRARAANGTVENEICPVFTARVHGVRPDLNADPTEVMEWRWVPWEEYKAAAQLAPWLISPWSGEQIRQWPDAHPHP